MHVVSWETNKTFFKIYFAANRGKPKLSNMGPVSPYNNKLADLL